MLLLDQLSERIHLRQRAGAVPASKECVCPLSCEDEKRTTYYHGEEKFFSDADWIPDTKNVLLSKLDSLK
jgi:hypothetical protein